MSANIDLVQIAHKVFEDRMQRQDDQELVREKICEILVLLSMLDTEGAMELPSDTTRLIEFSITDPAGVDWDLAIDRAAPKAVE